MNIERLRLPEILLLKPGVHRDERGEFRETWRAAEYGALGLPTFVQDNTSLTKRGVVRGLHFQHPNDQGKLVSVLRGRILDVAVDVRAGSPSFGQWVGTELSDENGHQMYIPMGFAHGFMALTEGVVFSYKCTDYYAPAHERTIRWNDGQIGVTWPDIEPIVAPKDAAARSLAEMPPDWLPAYTSA
jgi:dTDP-4-dehydrorhamnose 3,5-epimerase